MKTALVTGAAGFLGSHLVRSLLNDGYFVIGMDNLQTGSMDNIREFMSNQNFMYKLHDVTSPYIMNVDEIWNLACPASPPKYQMNPVHTLMTSVMGIKHALEASDKPNVKVFQASTSEVYGDPQVDIQNEIYWGNVNPNGIRSCYDEGKRVAETLMIDHNRMFGTNIRIARIFNTYGPSMDKDDGRVITNFINQALHNEPITIYGRGDQTRSFCYVTDLIRGFRLLMDSDEIMPTNLGNPVEFDMLQLAKIITLKTGSKSSFVFKDLPGDDPKQRKPDISKAQRILGWKPEVMLGEGLDKTIEYFKRKM